jgi:hypothetical protein
LISRRDTLTIGLVAAALAGCGGGSRATSPDRTVPTPVAIATPTPTPTPTPQPAVPAACQLKAPTIDCSTHDFKAQELAPALQAALDTAMSTAGVMYAEYTNRVYDLPRFRSIVVDTLAAGGICGAWDYGNFVGDEIYVRSADGCAVEQYDILTGEGGVRPANKTSNVWQADWGTPVPGPKPDFVRDGDLTCTLPGDRSTFCFTIKGTPGAFGGDAYAAVAGVMNESPQLFDPRDRVGGQTEFEPDVMRPPAWHINDVGGYLAAVVQKLHARGYCAYVEKGDILKVKSLAKGNLFHEEFDIVQNPAGGGDYVSFSVKDRCHDAGF